MKYQLIQVIPSTTDMGIFRINHIEFRGLAEIPSQDLGKSCRSLLDGVTDGGRILTPTVSDSIAMLPTGSKALQVVQAFIKVKPEVKIVVNKVE